MSSDLHKRKHEHLEIARHAKDIDRRKYYFDNIRLTHRALPEINYEEIETQATFLGRRLALPLILSCMTGSAGAELVRVNRNLAQAAQATGIAMGTGSMRILLEDESAWPAFDLRACLPDVPLLGNLGAVQLNYGVTPAQVARLAERIGMDALYLHLNPLQEVVQPEGQTRFRGLADRIRALTRELPIPVIIKEVGAGISPADVRLLVDAGVRYIDAAGAGGTSWSRIEYERDADATNPGLLFQDWGLSTPQVLRLLHPFRNQLTLIASGGIRTGIDMAKAIVLGASLCGIARPFLEPATVSPQAVIDYIQSLQREFQTAMFLLGTRTIGALIDNRTLLLDPAAATGEDPYA